MTAGPILLALGLALLGGRVLRRRRRRPNARLGARMRVAVDDAGGRPTTLEGPPRPATTPAWQAARRSQATPRNAIQAGVRAT